MKLTISSLCALSVLLFGNGCDDESCQQSFDCNIGDICVDGLCELAPTNNAANPIIRSFDAVPALVAVGAFTDLQWTSTDATDCEITYDDVTLDVPCSGSREVLVERETQYTLRVASEGGTSQRIARVSVFSPDGGVDAGIDGGDAGVDAGIDGGIDGGFDAGGDAGLDGGVDAGFDGGFDAGIDGGFDAGIDGGVDAGFDAGVDGGVDAGPVFVAMMSLGGGHSCGVSNDGRLKCFGKNFEGELGLKDTNHRGDEPDEMGQFLPDVDVGGLVASVACGSRFTCALLRNGDVKCFGENDNGQLGLGHTESRGGGTGGMGAALLKVDLAGPAAEIHAGGRFACALLVDGRLQCWGRNLAGELGLGDTNHRGDAPDEMGANLPSVSLPLPVLKIGLGQNHVCVLLAGDSLRCWGNGTNGELGLEDTLNRGDEPGEMGASLAEVLLSNSIADFTVGTAFTCAILLDGQIKCFGRNSDGQLGLGDVENRGDGVGEMGAALQSVPLPVQPASLLSAGSNNFIVSEDGAVFGWGSNIFRQLGLSAPLAKVGDAPNEMGINLSSLPLSFLVSDFWTSGFHSCARSVGDQIYCWGKNHGNGHNDTLSPQEAVLPVSIF